MKLMKLWSGNFRSDALLYVNFFQNFLMKITEDVKKSCYNNLASMLQLQLEG